MSRHWDYIAAGRCVECSTPHDHRSGVRCAACAAKHTARESARYWRVVRPARYAAKVARVRARVGRDGHELEETR
jgi:hypothetical protein